MTIDRIKMFLAVYTEGSVSDAAKYLHVSQPAVTQGIKALEESLDCQLFNREGRKMVLSLEGHKFLIHARQIIKSYDTAMDDFIEKKLSLNVGSSLTVASYILADVISSYEKGTEKYVSIICSNMQSIHEMIDSNEIEVAFIQGIIKTQDYMYHQLGEFHLVFVASPQYIEKRTSQASDDSFLIRETGSTYRTMFEMVCDDLSLIPSVKWISTSNAALKQAALNHQGIALLSKDAVINEIENHQLIELDLYQKELREPFGLLYKQAKNDNASIIDFVDFVIDYFKDKNL